MQLISKKIMNDHHLHGFYRLKLNLIILQNIFSLKLVSLQCFLNFIPILNIFFVFVILLFPSHFFWLLFHVHVDEHMQKKLQFVQGVQSNINE